MDNPFVDTKKKFETLYAQLQEQKAQIQTTSFANEAERISYLKAHYLPLLVEAKLADNIWQFELHLPLGGAAQKDAYRQKVLSHLHDFFYKHPDWVAYYRRGDAHLDPDIFEIESPALTLYANVISAHLFDDYLLQRFEGEQLPALGNATTLTWTNKQVALVELATALHEAKVFNEGQIPLSTLISTLANTFHLKLTQDPNRIFQDIKNRKKRQTCF